MIEGSWQQELHIDLNTMTMAVHTAQGTPAPVHLVNKVRKDIECDVALGVIEQLLINTPVAWRSQMHVEGKKDWACRGTVDLHL